MDELEAPRELKGTRTARTKRSVRAVRPTRELRSGLKLEKLDDPVGFNTKFDSMGLSGGFDA